MSIQLSFDPSDFYRHDSTGFRLRHHLFQLGQARAPVGWTLISEQHDGGATLFPVGRSP
jgi:hypothetical protein